MSEFVKHKQKTISKIDELLPPCWVHTKRHIDLEESGRYIGTQYLKIIETDSTGFLRNRLVMMLDSAKDSICVASFLIADSYIIQAMLRASERGVRVYLLTASETQLLREPKEDNEFDALRLKEHIRTLEQLAGRVLVRTGENLHSKFVLVDPQSSQAQGFLLTANLTSEALTRNVEIGVELDSDEVHDLFRQFLIGFWIESSNELLEPGSISKIEPLSDVVLPSPLQLLSTTSRTSTIKQRVDALIDAAKSEIIVSSFGIDMKHETTQKIIQAARAGTKVRILSRPRPNKNTMNALIALVEAGAEVRGHRWLHAKCVLADTNEGWSGLVMTSNVESHGLDKGFESGISLHGKDADSLYAMAENWWRNFPQLLFTKKKLGDVEGDVLLWSDETLKKITIKKRYEEDLGEFTAKSFDEIEGFQPNLVPEKTNKEAVKYHEHTFHWTVLPPKLPPDAKRESSDGDIDVYKYGGESYIVVQRAAQLSKARKLASELHAKIVTL